MQKESSIMIRGLTLAIISFFLVACATEENYQLALNSWRGANINQLVTLWGYPDQTSRAPDGNRLFIYRLEERGRNPVYVTPAMTNVVQNGQGLTVMTTPGMVSGGGTYDFHCTTWVEVNKHNIIVNTAFRGNNCVATGTFVNTHANPAIWTGQ